MMIICWSVKGGSGTTVVAASLALTLARREHLPVLIVDLAGDLPGVFALPEPEGPGVHDWLAADRDVAADALSRLTVPVVDGLDLIPAGDLGAGAAHADRWKQMAEWLGARSGAVVIDCAGPPPETLAARATMSLLVMRPCYLAARKASRMQHSPVTGIVLVTEPGRALTRRQIEAAVGAPVVAEIPLDPSIARAVDAGLLSVRLPKTLSYPMERVA
jgi:MinD-like ATPase involved in chromosome partitioning or flagellar assembly